CSSSSSKRRDLSRQVASRRHQTIERLRAEKRAEKSRSIKNSANNFTYEVLLTSHKSNLTGITADSDVSKIFESSNSSTCLLQPEATIGPYWVAGEYVREDVSEDQPGVPLYMSAQFLDYRSCEPVSDMYWEIWQANATGVYSGVVASNNGDGSDASNLNATFLRGMVKTDELGEATIRSIFPGHYAGRAIHVHVIGHTNATLLPNNTIGTGTGASGDSTSTNIHIGQLFFDQDLIDQVEKTHPYNTNLQNLTRNEEDFIFYGETTEGAPDPVFEYVLLGEDVTDGIFAWVTVGLDKGADHSDQEIAASTLTEDGAVAN
ncbi:aromatic compound dioxygenase, partial [Violaceomyces palustris]